jgi:hypothetical protein
VQADELELNNTTGPLLQSQLGREYEVFQYGFSSWSPLLELNAIIKTYEKIQPDKVFIVLVLNDFFDQNVYSKSDAAYTAETLFDSQGYPISFNVPANKNFFRGNIYRNLVPLFLSFTREDCKQIFGQKVFNDLLSSDNYDKYEARKILGGSKILENEIRLSRNSSYWDYNTSATVNLSFKYLSLMNSFLKSRNTSLTVMLAPLGWNFAGEMPLGRLSPNYCIASDVVIPVIGMKTQIKEFAFKNGIGYIELYDTMVAFKKENPNMNLFFVHDGHWTVATHRLVSKQMFLSILESEN